MIEIRCIKFPQGEPKSGDVQKMKINIGEHADVILEGDEGLFRY